MAEGRRECLHLSYQSGLPEPVSRLLLERSATFVKPAAMTRPNPSWANHCPHCAAVFSDDELHCEPGGFMPSDVLEAQAISLTKVEQPFSAFAAGYALDPEFFASMRGASKANGHLFSQSEDLWALDRQQRGERSRLPRGRAHPRRADRKDLRSFRPSGCPAQRNHAAQSIRGRARCRGRRTGATYGMRRKSRGSSDARTAREYLVALPAELSPQARINLVAGFSRELVERYRFALDIAIHAPRDYPGSDPRNFHAHLLATTREVTPDGLGRQNHPRMERYEPARESVWGRPSASCCMYASVGRWQPIPRSQQEHINARIDHRTLQGPGD